MLHILSNDVENIFKNLKMSANREHIRMIRMSFATGNKYCNLLLYIVLNIADLLDSKLLIFTLKDFEVDFLRVFENIS